MALLGSKWLQESEHREEVSRKNDKEAIVRVLIGVGIGITNFWELICFFIKKINW